MFALYVIVEMSSRSIESAAAAATALTRGHYDGFSGSEFGGSNLEQFWTAAGDAWDTFFLLGAIWYMLRFFR